MGAYLTVPNTEKESSNNANEYIEVGASSMQGWRISQEDAHNCILDYDENMSFFSVYDGHGGSEVATYCAEKLPAFLKTLQTYSKSDYEQALKDAFLGFDKTLLDEDVIDELKRLAEKNPNHDSDFADDEEEEDLTELRQEGSLPLHQVLEKYKGGAAAVTAAEFPHIAKLKQDEAGSSGSGISKPLSPFLRGRRNQNNDSEEVSVDNQGPPKSMPELLSAADVGAGDSLVTSSSCNKLDITSNSSISESCPEGIASGNEETNLKTMNGVATENQSPDSSSTTTTNMNSEIVATSKSKVQNGDITSSNSLIGTMPTTLNGGGSKVVDGCRPSSESGAQVEAKAMSSGCNLTTGGISSSSSTGVVAPKAKCIAQDIDDSSSDDDADFHADDDNSTTEDGEEDCDAFDDSDEEANEELEDEETEDEEEGLMDDDDTAFCHNMIEEPGKDSGCTAVVTLIHGRDLYVANAGDSRCVVCRDGKAIEMSLDHKPEDDEESERITLAGGKVTQDGRVNGGLNLSRAIGDHAYKMNQDLPPEKQMISALPDIRKLIISPGDEFMILACDGIWNFMSSDEVVEFVKKRLDAGCEKLSQICEELFDHCLAPNTMGDGTGCDNMTAVLIRFKPTILNLPTKISTESEAVAIASRSEAEKAREPTEKTSSSSLGIDTSALVARKRHASLIENSEDAEGSGSTDSDGNAGKRIKTDAEAIDRQSNNALDDGDVAFTSSSVTPKPAVECESAAAT